MTNSISAIPTADETIAALQETERGPLEPFVHELNDYWDQGDGADPSRVLQALPCAREGFEVLERASRPLKAGADAVECVTPTVAESAQEAPAEPTEISTPASRQRL